MLRRKLLIMFGSVVALLAVLAVLAVLLLQRVMGGLDHVNREAMALVAQTSRLNTTLSQIELQLYQLQMGSQRHLDELIRRVESLREQADQMREHYLMHREDRRPQLDLLRFHQDQFERAVASLATAQDADLARQYNVDALGRAMELRHDVHELDRHAHDHAVDEQMELARNFRWLVLSLTMGGMVVVNLVILALLRTSSIILRPVDALVQATRELARENFDHRVRLDQKDEFSELGASFNSLAQRLAQNEQRRMEVLHQVSLTLNHELNNVLATVDMQLHLLGRQANGSARFETSLRQIQENLQRMARTIQSLKNVRRIVLTDYVSGVKMLDLEQSVLDQPAPAPDPPPPAEARP